MSDFCFCCCSGIDSGPWWTWWGTLWLQASWLISAGKILSKRGSRWDWSRRFRTSRLTFIYLFFVRNVVYGRKLSPKNDLILIIKLSGIDGGLGKSGQLFNYKRPCWFYLHSKPEEFYLKHERILTSIRANVDRQVSWSVCFYLMLQLFKFKNCSF